MNSTVQYILYRVSQIRISDHVSTVQSIFSVCVVAADLCGSFLDHFQLALVDLDAPEETIKEPQKDPSCQPEQRVQSFSVRQKSSPFLVYGNIMACTDSVYNSYQTVK